MPSIGEHLVALGDLSAGAFRAFIRAQFVSVQTAALRALEEKLAQNAGKYKLWEKDVRIISKGIKRSITDENSIVPLDLAAEIGNASSLEFAQTSIVAYGRLLLAWEELVNESRNLIQEAA